MKQVPVHVRYCPTGANWVVRVNDGDRMVLHAHTVKAIIAMVQRGAGKRYHATIRRCGAEAV